MKMEFIWTILVFFGDGTELYFVLGSFWGYRGDFIGT